MVIRLSCRHSVAIIRRVTTMRSKTHANLFTYWAIVGGGDKNAGLENDESNFRTEKNENQAKS